MQVGVLGPVRVEVDGVIRTVAGARLRGLLARLAAEAGRPVSASTLATSLWADADSEPVDPGGALQSLVSRLRRALGRADVLVGVPGGYRLDVARDDVDALRFEALVADGRRALAAGDPGAARDLLVTGLALWRGQALADVADLPFAPDLAGRWERLRLAAVEERIEAELQLGSGATLVEELQELTAEHPLRERLHAQLMRAFEAAGRGAEALAHYAAVRSLLAEELGTDPAPHLQALHTRLLTDPAPPPAAAPAPLPPRPQNQPQNQPQNPPQNEPLPPATPQATLPLPLTSFVGRDEDVHRIGAVLRDGRLVTLVGPGGAGKTRLAIEVGHRWAEGPGAARAVENDVRLVPLAPVSAGSDVARAALAALDGRERTLHSGRPPAREPDGATAVDGTPVETLERLVDVVGVRHLLLVLDNCEHVIAEAADLADALLRRCPGLRILATSREPLHVLGEALYAVDPLELPEEGCSPEQALAVPAVRLLADRAGAVLPGFAVDATTVAPAVEICRRLDGLPLAIELAAARLRTLPIALLAARLDDRFRLLTGGNRTALPRQQTLRAVVAWSWDLLGDTERLLLERLSILPGGFDEELAAALAPAGADDVPDLLAALQDRSLLQSATTSSNGLPRYRMLETLREFGLERLAERGEAAAVRARATAHLLALAETAEPHLRTRDQLIWLALLRTEHDNLLAAIRWAAEAGDAGGAVRLCTALAWYWTLRGSFGESLTWLDLALAVEGPVPAQARAIAIVLHTMSGLTAGRVPTPEKVAEVIAVIEAVPEPRQPLLVMAIPALAIVSGDLEGGLALSRSVQGADGDPWTRATLHLMEGVFSENAGEVDRALAVLPQAVAIFREIGDRWGISTALTSLGEILPLVGDLAGGLAALQEAARHSRELGALEDAAQLEMRMLALELQQDGDGAEMRRRLEEVLAQAWAQYPGTFLAVGAEAALAELDERDGRIDDAIDRSRRSLAALQGQISTPPQAGSMVRAQLAHQEVAAGRPARAAEVLRDDAVRQVFGWDMPVAARVGVAVAAVRLAAGDAPRAALLLGAAAAVRGREDPQDRRVLRLTAVLHEELDDDTFRAAYDAGAATPRPQALDLLTGAIWPDD